jgi:hypothetical protein
MLLRGAKDLLGNAVQLISGRGRANTAPAQVRSALDAFKACCAESLRILSAHSQSETPTLQSNLAFISTVAQDSLDGASSPCFDYLIEDQVLWQLANAVTPTLCSEHVDPLLTFVLRLLHEDLYEVFVQVHIHEPIAAIISRLDLLDRRSPVATRSFVNELWNTLPNSPVYMEMLGQPSESGRTYPLLDYLLDSIWFPWEEHANALNRKPHALIIDFFYRRPQLHLAFGPYVCDRLFARVVPFLVAVCGYAETVQFRGAVIEMTEFCDRVFRSTREFPMLEVVRKVPERKLFVGLAFLLAHFTEKRVVDALFGFCTEAGFLGHLAHALNGPELRESALVLIRCLLNFEPGREAVLPFRCESRVDILGLLPANWKIVGEGTQNLSAYVTEARVRAALYAGKRPEGGESEVYGALVRLLGQYRELGLQMALEVLSLVSLFVAIAPDLVNEELAEAVRAVVGTFHGIELGETPRFDAPDTPELRAALFLEFVKEIAGTVIAARETAVPDPEFCE